MHTLNPEDVKALLDALQTNIGQDLIFLQFDGEDKLYRIDSKGKRLIWSAPTAPDLEQIQHDIRAIVDKYYPDGWSYLVLEYDAEYYAGEGAIWNITNHTILRDADGVRQGQDFGMLQEIEDLGTYSYLAEALIDTIDREVRDAQES